MTKLDHPGIVASASREDRLFLKRTVGSWSGGTQVSMLKYYKSNDEYTFLVRPRFDNDAETVVVEFDDLVVRRGRD